MEREDDVARFALLQQQAAEAFRAGDFDRAERHAQEAALALEQAARRQRAYRRQQRLDELVTHLDGALLDRVPERGPIVSNALGRIFRVVYADGEEFVVSVKAARTGDQGEDKG
jgi:hypothetical protein